MCVGGGQKGERASRTALEVDKAAAAVDRAERTSQVQALVLLASLAVAIPAVVLISSLCLVDVE